MAARIDAAFGSYDDFKKAFAEAGGHAIRQRLGMAGRRERRAQGRQDRQRRSPVHQGADAAADDRCLGARLLPRLPESARRSRQRGDRQAAQLAVRRRQSRQRRRHQGSTARDGPLIPWRAPRRRRRAARLLAGGDRPIIGAFRLTGARPGLRWRSTCFPNPRSRASRRRASRDPTPAARGSDARSPPGSARELAATMKVRPPAPATRRAATPLRPNSEREITVTGPPSLIEWTPGLNQKIQVAEANPGLCAVLENAALLYANGQAPHARAGARGRHRQRRRCEGLAARLARIVRSAAARGRPRRLRSAVAAVCGRVRAFRAVARGARDPVAPGRASGGGGLRRPDRQAQRRARAADRQPARGVAKAAAAPSRSRLAHRRRRRRREAAGRCAGAIAQAPAIRWRCSIRRRSATRSSIRSRRAAPPEKATGYCCSNCCNGRTITRCSRIARSNSPSRSKCRRRRGSRRPRSLPADAGRRCAAAVRRGCRTIRKCSSGRER